MADDLTIKSEVIDAIGAVEDPESKKTLLDAHLIERVDVEGGVVTVELRFEEGYPKASRWELEDALYDKISGFEGVEDVRVSSFVEGDEPAPSGTPAPDAAPTAGPGGGAPAGGPPPGAPPQQQSVSLAGVGKVIAVASGKGGVGKSTVAVNLALALQRMGLRAGLLDVDIYGPSLPTLLGVMERPNVKDKRIVPLEAHGLKLMSLGFLMDDDTPVIWRGPIVTGIIRQFLQDVDWTGIDYLIVDMPPGTGDAQLSLAQTVPVDGAIVVTTPSDLALIDAARGLRMFNTLNVDVIGIVENMSHYRWPGLDDVRAAVDELRKADAPKKPLERIEKALERYGELHIFGEGGGKREAERLGTTLLGQIPLDGDVRAGGDEGRPVVVDDPEGPVASAFLELAQRLTEAKPLGESEPGAAKKGLFSFLKS